MSFIQHIRAETATDHDAVDARYGRFSLDDSTDYTAFLLAHARALPAVETALMGDARLPDWRERTSLLTADLAALGADLPVPLAFTVESEPARWGALYVIEGSRLGGAMLARGVPMMLPSTYLAARHLSGEWRALLAAIDERAARADAAWRAEAVAGARATFALYEAAAS